jgi:CHAT domain-containing protein
MKLVGLLLLFAALFTTSCEKAIEEENPLMGKWLWQRSVGGTTGSHTITPSDPPPSGGYKMLYVLNESEYFLDRAQDNFKRLRYTTNAVTNIVTGLPAQGILFYDEFEAPGNPQVYTIEGNQLIIKDNVTEDYIHYYTRSDD